jgi:mono/diheme cytochrome c family protein
MLKGIILGIVLGFVLIGVGLYFYFASGQAPVATKSPEMPFEHKLAHMALDAYLNKMPHTKPQIPEDERTFLEGAKVYKEHCAVCHGLPGEPETSIAKGMFPRPPQLFRGTGVTDDEAWETYWKVDGGIRMTGMPGFRDALGENRMWQVSILLKNADKIPPAVKAELANPVGAPAVAPGATPPAPVAPGVPPAAAPAKN